MFYLFLKYLTRLAFKVYFRNLYLEGIRNVPLNKPVILASNHPSAFMEACLLAVFLPRPLYFLTRGDVFKGPLMKWLLRATHQIPIYRFRDGFENLRSNSRTFQICYDKLEEGEMILIFCEAGTALEKRLRPIQKGTAKLALGTLQQAGELDLDIVPVAINFEDPRRMGTDVFIYFSEAIQLGGRSSELLEDQKNAIAEITGKIKEGISEGLVQIPDTQREKLTEFLFEMDRNDQEGLDFPFVRHSMAPLQRQMHLAGAVHLLSEEEFLDLENLVTDYEVRLKQLGIRDEYLSKSSRWGLVEFLLLSFASIYSLVGGLYTAIPKAVYRLTIAKKVKSPPFVGPIKLAAGMVLFILYFILVSVILSVFYGWVGLLLSVLLLMAGYFSIKKGRWVMKGFMQLKMLFLSKRHLKEALEKREVLEKWIMEQSHHSESAFSSHV